MKEKILKLIFIMFIGYPLYFLSFLFPRTKGRWVFGNGNSFSGNAKYLFLDVVENHKDIDAAWVSKNKKIVQELQQKNLSAYYVYSLKGIKYLLSANIYCLANCPSIISDISLPLWTMGKAQYIQLWHGVGVKKLLFKRDNKQSSDRIKHSVKKYFWLPVVYNYLLPPSLFLSTSKSMSLHFEECFRLEQKIVIESNYPRCQVFKESNRREYIDKYSDTSSREVLSLIQSYQKKIIYMPTFREGNDSYLSDAGFDYEELNTVMKKMCTLFIFKLHPGSKVDLPSDAFFSNLYFIDSNVDIYPIIPDTDILITDYSSIYYDYLLMSGKYTIFFDYDRKEYINERDFAFDYDEYTNGIKVKTFDELLESLKKESYLQVDRDKEQQLREFFWGFSEDKVDLVQEIKKLEL